MPQHQVNVTICAGMGKTGLKRIRLYRQGIKRRGYKSLSAYVVKLLDRELQIELPKSARRQKAEAALV